MSIRFYEGERIDLRPIEPRDELILRRWYNDPHIWATLARTYPINEPHEREFIDGLYKSPDQCVLGIVVREHEHLIGVVGLRELTGRNRCASFGIIIGDREFQSRGFGTEATRLMLKLGFEEFNLNRIELSVMAGNARGIRAYERAGFVLEGRLRERYFRGGQYVDLLEYGILKREWKHSQVTDNLRKTENGRHATPIAGAE